MAPSWITRIRRASGFFVSPVLVPCEPCTKQKRQGSSLLDCDKCRKAIHESELRVETGDDNKLKIEYPAMLFEEKNESPSIQLFYDLFFVAVLSACSTTHEITDAQGLKTYIQFLALVWLTWFGTILFDVRFAIDCWSIRLSKAISIGIMALFAMTLVPFSPKKKNRFGHDLQVLGLVLMVSRIFLAIQYGLTMLYIRARRPGERWIWPFIASIATHLAAAVMFAATYPIDGTHSSTSVTIWWATSLAEAAMVLFISCYWKAMSFYKTNLAERMGALTLIVMGEGIIGLTDSISKIMNAVPKPSNIAILLGVVVILTCYSIWILYFDHTDTVEEPADAITKLSPCRQIWAILHFPLHIAILMTLKGCAAFMLWCVVVEALSFAPLQDLFNLGYHQLPSSYPNVTGAEIHDQVKRALGDIAARYNGDITQKPDIQDRLHQINDLELSSNSSALEEAWNLSLSIAEDTFSAVCEQFQLCGSDSNKDDSTSGAGQGTAPSAEESITNVFAEYEGFWFVTLFVAAGSVLVMLAILKGFGFKEESEEECNEQRFSSTPKKCSPQSKKILRKSLVAVVVQAAIGLALATVAFMDLDQSSSRFENYIFSQWIVPTVLLTYVLGKI